MGGKYLLRWGVKKSKPDLDLKESKSIQDGHSNGGGGEEDNRSQQTL